MMKDIIIIGALVFTGIVMIACIAQIMIDINKVEVLKKHGPSETPCLRKGALRVISRGKHEDGMKRKYFYCERWRIQMFEEACINRYKKGLSKCAGCEKGRQLMSEHVRQLIAHSPKLMAT